MGSDTTIDVDDGQDGLATRRLLQLGKWLHQDAPSRFTWQEVCHLDSWRGLDHSAFRAAFSVAKARLATIGITIDFDEQSRRYVHRHRVVFTPAERQALVLALAVADVIAPVDDDAVELGLGIDRHEAELTVVVLDDVSVILDAIHARCPVEISHRGQRRRLDPYGIGLYNGRWYVAGRDHRSGEQRVFGLGRSGADDTAAAPVAGPGSFDIPPGFDMDGELASLGHLAWRDKGAPVHALVEVDADAVPLARLVLAADPETPAASPPAARATFAIGGPDVDAIVYRVLALRARARIVEPPAAVLAMRRHLFATLGRTTPEDIATGLARSSPRHDDDGAAAMGLLGAPDDAAPQWRRPGRLTPQRRLRILSVALSMCEAVDGPVSISAIAEQAGAGHEQVLRALRQYEQAEYSLLYDNGEVFGIGPASNGIAIDEEHDTVRAHHPWWLDTWRPLPREALRLWIAASLVLALHDGASPALRSARTKLGDRLPLLPRIVEEPPPPYARRLRDAVASRRTLWVEHLSDHGDARYGVAELDPVRVRRDRGVWVVEGRVRRRAGGTTRLVDRTLGDLPDRPELAVTRFELSRITDWKLGDRAAQPPDPGSPLLPADESPVELLLVVDRSVAWMLDPFDPDEVRDVAGGRVRIRVTLPGDADLRTLLLRLGRRGRVDEPEALVDLPLRLATQVLARYG